MLTPDGAAALTALLANLLEGGSIRVGNEEESATAPVQVTVAGDTVTVHATFDELEANFGWTFRDVVVNDIVVDHDESDFGRKILGAVWKVDVPITTAGA